MIDTAPICVADLLSTACVSCYRNVHTLANYMHYTHRYTAYLHINTFYTCILIHRGTRRPTTMKTVQGE